MHERYFDKSEWKIFIYSTLQITFSDNVSPWIWTWFCCLIKAETNKWRILKKKKKKKWNEKIDMWGFSELQFWSSNHDCISRQFFGLIIIPMEVLDKADKKQAEKLNCWREQTVISANSEGLRCWSFWVLFH